MIIIIKKKKKIFGGGGGVLSVPCFAMRGLQLYKVSRLYFAERPECVYMCDE